MEVENKFRKPYFTASTQLEMPQRELIYFLQAAVAKDGHFHFTAEYYATPAVTGYMVLSLNKLAGSTEDKTYWQILDNGKPIPVGVSLYVPNNGSVITFKFTSYGNDDCTKS
ncbi:cobalamin binding intrinsic factor-like [Haliotis rubra]|uniref:cobalamin binding intrinsic factor-like n=1 Tax=Haliotis rubra TaxID=36100 RepID=UPI001EE5E1C8|nr:cobalamin binding intrinsic factor-like [Haliotis rubra]